MGMSGSGSEDELGVRDKIKNIISMVRVSLLRV